MVRVARRLRLLARLASAIDQAGLFPRVPAEPARHLNAELRLSRWRTRSMSWAMECIGSSLHPLGTLPILLKGAAYVSQGLPIGSGRLPADIDIMVPREALNEAMQRLLQAGWEPLTLDAHDLRYYYEWSHEVPPLRHPLHTIELDLHHNILPPIGRRKVDAAPLFQRAVAARQPPWHVLHPVDQVLHSAAHLFFDAEARDRIRDLVDLDGLLRHFGAADWFWDDLASRAEELRLGEPLALACHFCQQWLATEIPETLLSVLARIGPRPAHLRWLVGVMASALAPADPDDDDSLRRKAAHLIILGRYHVNRMPLNILIAHAWHKTFVARRGEDPIARAPAPPR